MTVAPVNAAKRLFSLGDGDGDGETLGLGDGEPVGETLGDGDGETLGLGDGEPVGETLGYGDGETLGLGDGEPVGEILGEGVGVELPPPKTPATSVVLPFFTSTVEPSLTLGTFCPSSVLSRSLAL